MEAGTYPVASHVREPNYRYRLSSAMDQIIASNERIRRFWTEESRGWSPMEAANLLENSRTDRLVSPSHSLRLWTQPCTDEDNEGRLILAWANLGNSGRRDNDLVSLCL